MVTIGMAAAMGGKKAAAVLPKPRPDSLTIGWWQAQIGENFATEELEPALPMRGRQAGQPQPHLEQEHQPMALALIPVLADDGR